MCGIAAQFAYRSGAPDPAALTAACSRMASRGPDADGFWASDDGRVGLGHRRLSIIDLSPGGAQPMQVGGEGGAVTVVYNGEIYNYEALKRGLEARGHRFRSTSDTEVLLRLYQEEGEGFVERLRGMFALALWDAERGGLLLARDPYGIKPLYVADDGRTLKAASQVKALLSMGGVDTEPDPAGHAGFFLWGHVPEPHTLYRGVRAFPPGHTQWVDGDGARPPRPFASITDTLEHAERSRPPAGDPATIVREALLDSVRAHLVADVPVGVFLSAGRDSTALAGLAAEAGGRLRTVTLGFEEYAGTPDDEVPLAESVAQFYGAEHQTVRVGADAFRAAFPGFMDAMDQPTLDGLNSYLVSQAAAQSGLKVALSGLGGDELFGGYPSFAEIPRLVGALGPVPGSAALGRGLRAVSAPLLARLGGERVPPKLAGVVEYGGDYAGAYLLRRGLFMPWELPEILGPDLARAGWEALQPLAQLGETVGRIETPRLRVTALESAHYMRSQLLRDTDWASMAHSLEVRVPLVDWALLRRLAPLLAAHPSVGKQTMAAAARPALPPAITDRPKTGFTTPVRQWLVESGEVSAADRGLRGWAKYVYRRQTEAAPPASVPVGGVAA
ncbi:asparagine synthase (glutamine-hydrolyzing) [Rubrivirga sp. S365]|uniref:asparagine synthase (glutamine-hydrolyzing) n=1 Tax=Rubrivirga sp. S365 TaxID=3076080 RepID=UPI0028C75B8C|nr:asparagine synthase (glutamine-hydrolyzing) [Rubrivirga sp. S365]MDT7856647.1 asparagine synthase (glutamine-hydrolyzing) [Rubrivirga sp. S365]